MVAPHPPEEGGASDAGQRAQRAAHLGALHALAAPVHQAHAQDSLLAAGTDVLRHHGGDVARREGVEVQLARDGDGEGLAALVAQGTTGADSASSTGASHRSTSRGSAPLRRR
jgi:hypothetical protein